MVVWLIGNASGASAMYGIVFELFFFSIRVRLHQICRREKITADFTSLLALAEKSGNDVRSCLSMLQFFASMGKPLTIIDVLKSNIGQKDMQKGLFKIWEAIFQVSD